MKIRHDLAIPMHGFDLILQLANDRQVLIFHLKLMKPPISIAANPECPLACFSVATKPIKIKVWRVEVNRVHCAFGEWIAAAMQGLKHIDDEGKLIIRDEELVFVIGKAHNIHWRLHDREGLRQREARPIPRNSRGDCTVIAHKNKDLRNPGNVSVCPGDGRLLES